MFTEEICIDPIAVHIHAYFRTRSSLTSWEIIDLLFEKAKENGILILLDMHTLDPDLGVSRLWYDPAKYSEATVLWGWGTWGVDEREEERGGGS